MQLANYSTLDFAKKVVYLLLMQTLTISLEKLANGELWAIARSTVDEKLQRKLSWLMKKNGLGTITEGE